jgi:hypothetical protein
MEICLLASASLFGKILSGWEGREHILKFGLGYEGLYILPGREEFICLDDIFFFFFVRRSNYYCGRGLGSG